MEKYNKKISRRIFSQAIKSLLLIIIALILTACSHKPIETKPPETQAAINIKKEIKHNRIEKTKKELEPSAELKWYEFNANTFLKAKIKNKIMVLFFWSSNCEYCVKMLETTFKDEKVIKTLNNNFILVRVNGPNNPQAVETLLEDTPIFPSTVILGPAGNKVATVNGYVTPDNYEKMLEIIIEASK